MRGAEGGGGRLEAEQQPWGRVRGWPWLAPCGATRGNPAALVQHVWGRQGVCVPCCWQRGEQAGPCTAPGVSPHPCCGGVTGGQEGP